MSHIFLQKDNITILGDVYSYSHNKYDNENKLIETIEEKAVQIQIILVVNWKQRLYRTNYELELDELWKRLVLKKYLNQIKKLMNKLNLQ